MVRGENSLEMLQVARRLLQPTRETRYENALTGSSYIDAFWAIGQQYSILLVKCTPCLMLTCQFAAGDVIILSSFSAFKTRRDTFQTFELSRPTTSHSASCEGCPSVTSQDRGVNEMVQL